MRNSPPDRLESLELFLDWGLQNGLTDEESAMALRTASPTAPNTAPDTAPTTTPTTTPTKDAESFLAAARELRESLYRIFSALAADDRPAAKDLAKLDEELRAALPRLHLVSSDRRFHWALPPRLKRRAKTRRD